MTELFVAVVVGPVFRSLLWTAKSSGTQLADDDANGRMPS